MQHVATPITVAVQLPPHWMQSYTYFTVYFVISYSLKKTSDDILYFVISYSLKKTSDDILALASLHFLG